MTRLSPTQKRRKDRERRNASLGRLRDWYENRTAFVNRLLARQFERTNSRTADEDEERRGLMNKLTNWQMHQMHKKLKGKTPTIDQLKHYASMPHWKEKARG